MKKIAIIGTGVIGAGWAARFLAHGYDVAAWDPGEEAETQLWRSLEQAEPALDAADYSGGSPRGRLTFTADWKEAVRDAILIQENAPERLELKQDLIRSLDGEAGREVLIASSTSGITPSELQQGCRFPERVLVAHPFNPVYLLPLVELVGGRETAEESLEAAEALFRAVSMRPLRVRREVQGHLADRLMEALWREALHLVNDGVATTDEVDAAIIYGAGLRWAQMGPFLTFHMAGGEGGMRHMLRQFGPALKLPWTRLEAPELTEELIERVVGGCEAQAGERPVAEMARRRDEFLVKLLDLVDDYWPEASRA